MNSSPIVPCLWFDHQAEEAAAFYVATFPQGRIRAVAHYPESVETPSGKPSGSVLTVDFEVAGQRFTALNGGPQFVKNPSISFFAQVETAEEADRLYAALAEGGHPLMPLGSYPWSERYGWVADRFGVSWQVMTTKRGPGAAMIVPCLMFSGAVGGKAGEAIETYVRTFEGGLVESLERYTEKEGAAGWIKHGRFRLAGQEMIAMDSPVPHAFGFNEAISLQVMCESQAEVDRHWAALSEGGKEGPCGWLSDRFGVSWQIVPSKIAAWMSSPDRAARERAFGAMMKMGKLEIAELQRAFDGEAASKTP